MMLFFTYFCILIGTGFNLLTSDLSTLLFEQFKPVDTFPNISIFNLSIFHFMLARSSFLAKSDVSKPAAFFKSDLVSFYIMILIQLFYQFNRLKNYRNLFS